MSKCRCARRIFYFSLPHCLIASFGKSVEFESKNKEDNKVVEYTVVDSRNAETRHFSRSFPERR